MSERPRSAIVLIMRDGLVLAVSRKNDHKDLGLPGGSVEPGETYEAAAIRETFEEVGVQITQMMEVFDHPCRTHQAKTFKVGAFVGEPRSMEGAAVLWVRPEQLLAPHCSFRVYNLALFQHLGLEVLLEA